MNSVFRVAAGLLLVCSTNLLADGDPAAGQAKAAICAACHGADGNSMVPQWPKLAGQHADYLARQTRLIRDGQRPVPEMAGIVAGLTDADLDDLAAWFASQQNNGGVADESVAAIGEKIWRAGKPEAVVPVPACMACHGPAGEGNPLAGYPALAGQHATYTAKMLQGFRSGTNWGEKDEPSHVMNGAAQGLSDDDIAAVASYVQGLYLKTE